MVEYCIRGFKEISGEQTVECRTDYKEQAVLSLLKK